MIALAFFTYLVDPEDVVWRFIKHNPASRVLEHVFFAFATLLVGVAAFLCTRARAFHDKRVSNGPLSVSEHGSWRKWLFAGEFLYAIGLASLAPLAGFLILIVGEGIRISRLLRRDGQSFATDWGTLDHRAAAKLKWWEACLEEVFKWGLFFAMIAFTITLRDRLAEVLIAAACLVGFVLTLPTIRRSQASSGT